MYPARARDGHRVLPAGSSYKGVRVDLGNEALNLELFVIVDHSAHVPTVAAEVQRQVADAIDKMLGLEVREVNVFVGDVRFPEDSERWDGVAWLASSRSKCYSSSRAM